MKALLEEKNTRKLLSPSLDLLLKMLFRLLFFYSFYYYLFSYFLSFVCYCSMWLYFNQSITQSNYSITLSWLSTGQHYSECLYPTHNKVYSCVYWFHSVRPSVCPSVRPPHIPCPLCSAYSSCWIHFILYILSSNFRRCGACKVSNKITKFKFLAIF